MESHSDRFKRLLPKSVGVFPNIPDGDLQELVKAEELKLLEAVASHQDVTEETLRLLEKATRKDRILTRRIRLEIAKNKKSWEWMRNEISPISDEPAEVAAEVERRKVTSGTDPMYLPVTESKRGGELKTNGAEQTSKSRGANGKDMTGGSWR